MSATKSQKIYFLSDFHLGAPTSEQSLAREKKICSFLNEIRKDADEIFLMGDLFDFWYEYSKVVPKGYVRLLGTLASISDQGIPLHFFVGNHDMWVRNYFSQELNLTTYFEPITIERNGVRIHLGHGDGLGPGDEGYKRLKLIFRNPLCQWLFGILPPQIGLGLAEYFSQKSRAQTADREEHFLGEDKEWLISYCRDYLEAQPSVDYFLFGHRHLPIDWPIKTKNGQGQSRYLNLGDWIRYDTYAVLEGTSIQLKAYQKDEQRIIRSQ
ncbi:MAG: UDP-2,3-diacylglucosamine diphosphatase [Chitinophagaceae bacterium]